MNQSSTSLDNATCLADCNCDSSLYEPVCGSDGYTYASPCQAGCVAKQPTEGTEARALITHVYTHRFGKVHIALCKYTTLLAFQLTKNTQQM